MQKHQKKKKFKSCHKQVRKPGKFKSQASSKATERKTGTAEWM